MVFKSPWLSAAAIVVLLLLHHFATISAQLQSGDGVGFDDEEILQYYISTSPLEPCPAEMSSCLTLNQFASNTDYYLSENTSASLILQPGTHRLDSKLTVANLSQFSLIGEKIRNNSIVTIECGKRFTFENVTNVNVSGLQFVGCTENYIQSVEQFILENCTFNGMRYNGTALSIIESKNVDIINCSFIDTQGSYRQIQSLLYQVLAGGAIMSTNSSISIQKTIFERNSAEYGGAIFAEQESEIMLNECLFHNSTGHGGNAVFAESGSSVVVQQCTFNNSNNSIVKVVESNLLIRGCTYHNNDVNLILIYGSDSNITLLETVFEHTIVGDSIVYTSIVAVFNSRLLIQGCTYHNLPYFHLIYSQYSDITVLETRFELNNAYGLIMSRSDSISSSKPNILEINNCTFIDNKVEYFVVHLHCIHVSILHTHFINNKLSRIDDDEGTVYASESVLYMEECKFIGNYAHYGAMLYAIDCSTTMSKVYASNNVAYIAGVILIYSGNLTSNAISIIENRAGSGVVALASCIASFIGNTTFSNNEGSIFSVISTVILEGNVIVTNNTQFHNKTILTEEGGPISSLQSSIQVRGMLLMTNNSADNGGAMHLLESTFSMSGDITIANNHAEGSGGGIYLYQSRLNIDGECSISSNTARNGGGVYAVSSTVTLEENLRSLYTSRSTSVIFHSNKAMLGGALFLSTNTRIYAVLIGSIVHRINFAENTAEYGGALYIDDQTNPELCNGSSTTECFFQILALNPEELMNIKGVQNEVLDFIGNSANSTGDAIFGGLLDRCTLNRLTPSRRQIYGVNYIQNISNIDDVESISSHPVRLCFCIANQSDCSYNPPTINVMKGHTFNISVVAVDQVNHTLKSDVEAFLLSNNGLLGEGQKQKSVTTNCTNLTYNVITPHENEELLLNAVGPCGNAYASQRRVKVEFVNCTCPIGFQPATSVQTNCECECHSNLTNFVSTENCFPSSGTFKPNTKTWISYTNSMTEPNDYYLLVHPQCPYDYCKTKQVTISLSQPNGSNKLCDFNRADTLCGACLPGYSVSFGSSQCMKCYDKYWPLVLVGIILLKVIAGIAIVCVLLFLNITVAMGTINGILFYANIVYGNASIFFNNLPTPSFPSVFIAWLNLDIGFDVCLYDGIDTFAKTLLQLVFPIYLIILVVAVIIISKYSQIFSNLIGKKDPIATLATLILLSYAKILSIVITMLSRTTLEYSGGIKMLWKPDATIEYLKHPKHAILFFVAIIILLVSGTYTMILISWQLLVRLPNWKVFASIRNPKLSCFIGAYHAPYTSKHRYWTGLLLMLRVCLFLVSAINLTESTQEPLVAIMVAIGSLLLLNTRNVYKNIYLNIIEMVSLANTLAFTVFTWYATEPKNTKLHEAVAYISVAITCIMLIFVIFFHVYKYTKFNGIIKKTKFFANLQSIKSHVKKKPQRRQAVDLELANETRDVNIFELVNTNDNTCPQPQVQPSAQPHGVSHSTIEIPKPKEDQSQNNEGIHSVDEPSKK